MKKIEVKVPGKLYISGEYAVVEPGNPSIIMAVDKFIRVNICELEEGYSILKTYGLKAKKFQRKDGKIIFEDFDEKLKYVEKALEITEKYLEEKSFKLVNYAIEIESELYNEKGEKYGLGSSGAILVGLTRALLRFYGQEHSNMDIFMLSALSQLTINPSSSCGDIAASSFTGLILYRSFDRRNIIEKLENKEGLISILSGEWQGLEISRLDKFNKFKFIVAWSENPASTDRALEKLDDTKINREEFLRLNSENIDDLLVAYKEADYQRFKFAIIRNRKFLKAFTRGIGVRLEVASHEKFCDLAERFSYCGKTSGAGMGDCALVFYDDDLCKEFLLACEKERIKIIDINIWRENEQKG